MLPARRRCPRGPARQPAASFFICQPHAAQRVVHRGDGAGQTAGGGDFGERCAGMKPDVLPHLRSLLLGDGLLASHAEIQVVDDAEAFSLSEELLDEAEGDAEPLGDVLAGGVVFVAGGQDAGAQIEGEGFHGAGFYHVPARKSILFLENRARPGRRPFPASVRRLKRLHII